MFVSRYKYIGLISSVLLATWSSGCAVPDDVSGTPEQLVLTNPVGWQPGLATHTFVAIRSLETGGYLTAEYGQSALSLEATQPEVLEWGTFLLVEQGDGTIRLQGFEGDWIKANNHGGEALYMDSINGAGLPATFTPIDLGSGAWAFRADDGNHYIRIRSGGAIVDATAIGTNNGNVARFEILVLEEPPAPASNRFVALRSNLTRPNSPDPEAPQYYYVAGEYGNKYPAINVDRVDPGPWTTFQVMELGDGTVRLLHATSGEYLKVDATNGCGGGSAFLGVITGNGACVTYDVIRGLPVLEPDEVLFRTESNHYLTVDPSTLALEATATGYEDAAVFKLESVERLPWPGEKSTTIQSVQTGQLLSHGKVFASGLDRFNSNFVMVENTEGKASFTRTSDSKQLKIKTDGSGQTWFASGFGDHAYFQVVRGLPALGNDEVMLRTVDGTYLEVVGQALQATAIGYQPSAVFKLEPMVPEVVDARPVALRSRFVDAQATFSYLNETGVFSNPHISGAEKFTLYEYSDGLYTVANKNGALLSADSGGGAGASWITTDEPAKEQLFKLTVLAPLEDAVGYERVRLATYDQGHCLTANQINASDFEVDFADTCSGTAVEFDLIDLDAFPVYKKVAIQHVESGSYLSAEGGASFPDVTANRSSVGDWETFLMAMGPDRYVSLATYHGTHVWSSAYLGSDAGWLDCSQSGSNGYRAQFRRDDRGNDTYSFRTKLTGLDWRVNAQGKVVVGGTASTFRFIELEDVLMASDLLVNGDLVLPVGGGSETITLPNAQVTMTTDPWGELESLTGTAELPLIPGDMGALSAMGDMQAGARADIAWATGQEIIDQLVDASGNPIVVFPLNPAERYFFLSYSQVAEASWNGITVSHPASGTIQIALDHHTPTLFMYSDLPIFGGIADSAGFGVSGQKNIPWSPSRSGIYARGQEKTWNTDFWFMGEIPVPGLNLPEFAGVSVDAEVAMALDPGTLVSIDEIPSNGLEFFGANGVINLAIEPFDWLTVWQATVGEGSLIINNEDPSDPWIAFNGELGVTAGNHIELPLGLKVPSYSQNHLWVNGYFDTHLGDGHPSFIEIEARLKKFMAGGVESSTGTSLEGRFYGGENGLEFNGEAKMGGRYILVSGNVDSAGNGSFEGTFGEKFGARVGPKGCRARWSVEYELSTGFTFGQDTEVDFDMDARVCVGGCGIGNSCSSIGGEATIMDDGHIKVCAQVPTFGKKCDRL